MLQSVDRFVVTFRLQEQKDSPHELSIDVRESG